MGDAHVGIPGVKLRRRVAYGTKPVEWEFTIGRGFDRGFVDYDTKGNRLRFQLPLAPTIVPEADQFGAAPHTDWGCMTVLWQDAVGGLQVKNRAGAWIDAPYIDGTFVINIGDMLARWSNDLFVSTPHRVVNASGRERYSIPMFYDPDFDTVVECLPNCSSAANPPKYPRTIAGEYITAKYDDAYAYRKTAA